MAVHLELPVSRFCDDNTGVNSLRQEKKGASRKVVSRMTEERLDIQLQKRWSPDPQN